jgi:hypothetical protein
MDPFPHPNEAKAINNGRRFTHAVVPDGQANSLWQAVVENNVHAGSMGMFAHVG